VPAKTKPKENPSAQAKKYAQHERGPEQVQASAPPQMALNPQQMAQMQAMINSGHLNPQQVAQMQALLAQMPKTHEPKVHPVAAPANMTP